MLPRLENVIMLLSKLTQINTTQNVAEVRKCYENTVKINTTQNVAKVRIFSLKILSKLRQINSTKNVAEVRSYENIVKINTT